MEKKEQYNSAMNKLQKLFDTLYDEKGNLKPEFNLTDEEIEEFRNSTDDTDNERKRIFETLFGGIIYNKYTFMYEPMVEKICDLSKKIYMLSRKRKPSYNPNQTYACQAHNWNGNFLFQGNGDEKYGYRLMKSAKICLYNLNGTYSYEIELSKDENTSKMTGKITIIRDRVRKTTSWDVPSTYQDYGVEKHNLNEISSQEIADVIVITENELEQVLNSLVFEANDQSERTTGIRKR